MHFYRVSPEFRVFDMNCEVIAGTPTCWTDQYIESGQKFFNISYDTEGRLKNIPEGYELYPDDTVIHMGTHMLNTGEVPATPAEWTDPAWIYGTYDARVVFYEPMLPTHYVVGEKDDLSLPEAFTVLFNATSKVVSVSIIGKSNVCKEDFELAKTEYESMTKQTSGAASMLSTHLAVLTVLAVTTRIM
jgi:hypothetical protein